jgi:hypothetical protein
MAPDDARALHLFRLDDDERALIRNYRSVNETRQNTILFFSDELVKLERQDIQAAAMNVLPFRTQSGK